MPETRLGQPKGPCFTMATKTSARDGFFLIPKPTRTPEFMEALKKAIEAENALPEENTKPDATKPNHPSTA